MASYNDMIATLKYAGMRITPQRVAVCKQLCRSEAHPTAAMIFDSLRVQFPSISLATVYNTLDVLVELGAVNTLGHVGDGNVHYDADTSPHINMACVSCHKIIDLDTEHIIHMVDEIKQTTGFKLLGSRVVYYGICPECQQAKTDEG